ncbi:hypothetical protein E4O93_08955 [Diaphorobacter sp. DS2]|nr:hypothetical protein E4O93_08955 [Diaphorobacter sp. DS2]
MKMVKITLENGTVLEGSVEELRQMGVKLPVKVKPLEVGDYAKVIGGVSFIERLSEGDIVKISCKATNFDFRVKRLSDGTSELFMEGDLIRATDEEIAEAKKPAQPETITHEGVEYKRVDREAREGDVVVFTDSKSAFSSNCVPYGPIGGD